MEVGTYQLPLRMSFNPLSGAAAPKSPQRVLSQQLLGAMSRQAFQHAQAQFSASARQDAASGARSDLLSAVSQRLNRALEDLGRSGAPDVRGDALQRLGERLGEVTGLLEAARGRSGTFQRDALVEDLASALGGLFVPGGEGAPTSLGDLGFSIEDGHVRHDASVVSALAPEQVDAANAFLGTFISERVKPLLKDGVQAISDDQANAPVEKRTAQQAVMVQAEISRMQQRKTLLLFHQVSLEKQQDAIERQGQELKKVQGDLAAPEDAEQAEQGDEPLAAPAAATPASGSPAESDAPIMPPAVGAFGLSN